MDVFTRRIIGFGVAPAYIDGVSVCRMFNHATAVQPKPKHRHKGMLWGMYIRPSHRAAGIGRKLVEGIIAHARQHVELLQLFVISDNLPARRLYASLGFVEYGIERHATKYHGEYHDDVLMALPLVVDSAAEARRAPTQEISAEEVSA